MKKVTKKAPVSPKKKEEKKRKAGFWIFFLGLVLGLFVMYSYFNGGLGTVYDKCLQSFEIPAEPAQ